MNLGTCAMSVTILNKTYADKYEAAEKLQCSPTDVGDFLAIVDGLNDDDRSSLYTIVYRYFATHGVPDHLRPAVVISKDLPLRRQVSSVIKDFLGSVGDSVIVQGDFDIKSLRVYLSCSMFELSTRKISGGLMITRNR